MDAGIAYLPEDRHQEGLVLDFSIAQNVTLPILPRLFPRFLVNAAREREVARDYTEQFSVKMTGVEQMVGALSGGNQQKVVLAKWLASKPSLLILDEPTRGIDIGAKVEVHRIISELAASGLGIILISSDLPEVLAMSDRILVLHEGRITAEIARADATEERVMFAATGNLASDPVESVATVAPMAEAGATATLDAPRERGAVAGRRSPASASSASSAIMVVLGALVSLAAPQFLTIDNISQVAVLASIVAVAAVGEALVVITRNVDLSVEAMMGLVAYCVAVSLENHMFDAAGRDPVRDRHRARPRDDQRVHRHGPAGPGDRRDAGHAQHLPRRRLPDRRQPPGALAGPAAGLHRRRPRRHPRHPDLRRHRGRRRRHRVGPPALDQVRAPVLRRRQQPRGGGDPRHPVAARRLRRLRPVRSAGGRRRRHVRHRIRDDHGTSAGGYTLQVVAAVVVGGVGIFGGTGTLAGAALGALFLGFIANALILVGLSQFWLQAIYGLVILVAVSVDAVILRRLQRAASLNRSR